MFVRRIPIFFALLALLILLGASPMAAQGGGTLFYGMGSTGSINDQSPLAIYTFSAGAGDRVLIRATGITFGMMPSMTLNDPAQQPIASSIDDPFTPASALIAYRLRDAGTYTLLLGGTPGDYLIRLDGTVPSPSSILDPLVPIEVTLFPAEAPRLLFASADPFAQRSLVLVASPDQTDYSAELYSPEGALHAILGGGLLSACLTLPQRDGFFELVIATTSAFAQVNLTVTLRREPCVAPPPLTPPPPATTPDVGGPTAPPHWRLCR
ncbi:MAG: PPC domain-containing protein [Aggregatilineales bacterium]